MRNTTPIMMNNKSIISILHAGKTHVESYRLSALLLSATLPVNALHRARVSRAGTKNGCLETLNKESVDLIIFEVHEGCESEMEFLEQLCDAAPATAVVVVSSCEDQKIETLAYQNGATHYEPISCLSWSKFWPMVNQTLARNSVYAATLNTGFAHSVRRIEERRLFRRLLDIEITQLRHCCDSEAVLIEFEADNYFYMMEQRGLKTANDVMEGALLRVQMLVGSQGASIRSQCNRIAVLLDKQSITSVGKPAAEAIKRTISCSIELAGKPLAISGVQGVTRASHSMRYAEDWLVASELAVQEQFLERERDNTEVQIDRLHTSRETAIDW